MASSRHECVKCGHTDVLHAVINHVIKAHLQPSQVPFYCMKCSARVKTRSNALRHLYRFHRQDYRCPLKNVFAGQLIDWTPSQTSMFCRPVTNPPPVSTTSQPVEPVIEKHCITAPPPLEVSVTTFNQECKTPQKSLPPASRSPTPLPITPGRDWSPIYKCNSPLESPDIHLGSPPSVTLNVSHHGSEQKTSISITSTPQQNNSLRNVMRNLFNTSSVPTTPMLRTSNLTTLATSLDELTKAIQEHTQAINRNTESLQELKERL